MIKVGLIGLGAIGRIHYKCWRQSTAARLVAVSDRDEAKLQGKWSGQSFNIAAQEQEDVDLGDLRPYRAGAELIADPAIDIVDICMPTPLHAPLALAALAAGKHVFCEKPMSLTRADCAAMQDAARTAGRELMIGHCLRFWPQYVRASELLHSGRYGLPLYAELVRSSPAPIWSDSDWYMKREQSGGVFDMHIHDIDVALWWFGRPESITASGISEAGLPMIVNASWEYAAGPAVQLHASWDRNGGAFRHAFRIVMEKATIVHDLAVSPDDLLLLEDGKTTQLPVDQTFAYQAELDYFAQQIAAGRPASQTPLRDSMLAVELGLETMGQTAAKAAKR